MHVLPVYSSTAMFLPATQVSAWLSNSMGAFMGPEIDVADEILEFNELFLTERMKEQFLLSRNCLKVDSLQN